MFRNGKFTRKGLLIPGLTSLVLGAGTVFVTPFLNQKVEEVNTNKAALGHFQEAQKRYCDLENTIYFDESSCNRAKLDESMVTERIAVLSENEDYQVGKNLMRAGYIAFSLGGILSVGGIVVGKDKKEYEL